MKKHEQAVRDAATALHEAISDACTAGLVVGWPLRVDGLTTMAISETAKANRPAVTHLDGSPVERDNDGLVAGEPLNLTDEERAALPRLDPNASNDPAGFVHGTAKKRK
ncbi:hypothetical protein [Allomesorhizobium camelthorni]|uniref:Uncharacterized protein n=1 Tax=Allomesorhizobium camelthorni TaxID=475069 RepID=A0A6G4W858_9HYPH|nr:hypothetical protein [Mesorhizobium camelthorni]NGO50426.1 hypothetical protein [Mesorhizobium camelthorni]